MDTITREDLLIIVDHHSYSQTIEQKLLNKTDKIAIIFVSSPL